MVAAVNGIHLLGAEAHGDIAWRELYKKAGFPISHYQKLDETQKGKLEAVIKEALEPLAIDDRRIFLSRAGEYKAGYSQKNGEDVLSKLPSYEAAERPFFPEYEKLERADKQAEFLRDTAVWGIVAAGLFGAAVAGGEIAAYFSDVRPVQYISAGASGIAGAAGSFWLWDIVFYDKVLNRHIAKREARRQELNDKVEELFQKEVERYVKDRK